MKEYEVCYMCATRYSVSLLRDKSKVFICQDCVSKRAALLYGKKQKQVYDRRGYATVLSQ